MIINCQRPLMIERIVKLEISIRKVSGTIVDDPTELQNFVLKCEGLIQQWINENEKMKRVHETVIGQFIELYDVDLFSNKKKWTKVIEDAKSNIDKVCAGKPEDNKVVWTNHLSCQLLKVLEYQLKRCFLQIGTLLPKIQAQVRASKKKLYIVPAVNDIRASIFQEINKLLAFPKTFQFYKNWDHFCGYLPDHCAEFLQVGYSEADRILETIDTKLEGMKNWLALLHLNTEQLLADGIVKTGEEWESIVDSIRTKRRELSRTEEIIEADCVALNVSYFKMYVDEKVSLFLEDVLSKLEAGIQGEIGDCQVFVDECLGVMDQQPHSSDELRAAWDGFDEVREKKKDFDTKVKSLLAKVRLVQRLGRVKSDTQDFIDKWDTFESRCDNYFNELREKQETMKSEVEGKINTVKNDLETFASRWDSVKLKDNEQVTPAVAAEFLVSLADTEERWEKLAKNVKSATRDLEHFGMPPPDLARYDEIMQALATEKEIWALYKEFDGTISGYKEKIH
jgi:hypothetical protein